jgi:hypothetical protein
MHFTSAMPTSGFFCTSLFILIKISTAICALSLSPILMIKNQRYGFHYKAHSCMSLPDINHIGIGNGPQGSLIISKQCTEYILHVMQAKLPRCTLFCSRFSIRKLFAKLKITSLVCYQEIYNNKTLI